MQTPLLHFFIFLCFLPLILQAQHHEITSTEPPGDAYLGEINFPNSGPAEAQSAFIRGVLLLHSFEYTRAQKAFAEARTIAPSFAMAYWGEAMTHNHSIWDGRNREEAISVLAKLAPTPAERQAKAQTEREKLLGAVDQLFADGNETLTLKAYSQAMGKIAQQFPDDLEAKAFYSLSLLGLRGASRNTENYIRAAAVAEEVYEENKKHPGALHYLIHAYDDPIHAHLGLRAARLYGDVPRSASHAQHMPSHIFFALGMWDDAISANIASLKTARAGGATGHHPLHWLQYAYLQAGKNEEAFRLVDIAKEDARKELSPLNAGTLAMLQATWLVETLATDSEFTAIPDDAKKIDFDQIDAGQIMAAGLAHLRAKNMREARRTLKILRRLRKYNADDLPGSDDVTEQILASSIDFANGNRNEAIRRITAAAHAEDAAVFAYGPPHSIKPPWEAAGEMLLAMNRSSDAIEAFAGVETLP